MPSQPPTPATQYLGRPTRRIDGPLKVTGAAKYAAEYDAPGLLHGYVVSSSIAKGRVVSLDTAEALAFPGVVAVLSHQNRPDLAHSNSVYKDETAPPGEHFKAFQDDRIYFSAQPVALVVADSFEAARDASASVRVTYAEEPPAADFDALLGTAYVPPKKRSGIHPPPKPKGHFDAAYQASPVQVDGGYRVATEHNNPMEPHATTCVRHDDGTFTVYDKTQGSQNVHKYLVGAFGLKPTQVRVVNSYVGGGFGSGLRPQYQVLLAMMASVSLERPVRVVLTRDQMFSFTHRPETVQLVRLGAENDGKLNAIKHTAVASTSTFEDHQEVVVNWSTLLYHADNTELDYQLLQRNTYTPGDMRAPGAVIGEFAIESAMDELAEKLGMDPIALRLKNYTEKDENGGQRFTSKNLKGCYDRGAEAFGWAKRNLTPRARREGRELVGWGMATGVWETKVTTTTAELSVDADGHVTVASATSDIGTGTYTIMAQTAAELLGVPLDRVTVKLGDSTLPRAPTEGGSWGAASTCSAILLAAEKLKPLLLQTATRVGHDPLGTTAVDRVVFADGRIALKDDPTKFVTLADAVKAGGKPTITADATASSGLLAPLLLVGYTHSAIFAEVRVDEELGTVRVTRVVAAIAAGRILNPKTARSQILGGIVMALGSTLHEESMMDDRLGRFMNHNFAEYHVPTNADVEQIDVIFVDEPDDQVSPIGAKGLGEIGIVGTGAAVANAIYNATGRRVRELPITIDKVLGLTANHTGRGV